MYMMESKPENIKNDVENSLHIKTNQKRQVLGVITNNTKRIQPFRNTKKDEKKFEKTLHEVVSVLPSRLPRSNFTVYKDKEEHEISEIKKNDGIRKKEENNIKYVDEILENLPPIQKRTEHEDREDMVWFEDNKENIHLEVLENESPMIVDVSLNTSKINELYPDVYCQFEEYSSDIYSYLKQAEELYRPKPNYLRKQPDITEGMRSILIDWLVDVADEYRLSIETLYLSVSYIDRFLSVMSVMRSKLQLVGTAAIFIASKYEEIYPPDISEFVYITDNTYTKKQLLKMEQLILKVLCFDVNTPTVLLFLQYLCHRCFIQEQIQYLAMYISELSLLHSDLVLEYLPSIVCCSAIALAKSTLGDIPWDPQLQNISGYTIDELKICITVMHSFFIKASLYPQQAIQLKWKSVSALQPLPTLWFDT